MGRKPKPSHLKVVQGTDRKDRGNPSEAKPAIGIPRCPAWLSPKGKYAFRALAKELDGVGLMTMLDKHALELLCDAYAEWREARHIVETEGATYETTNQFGDVMHRARPEVAQASDAWKRVRSMLAEFGMTPSARSKVQAAKPGDIDPLEDFLKRRK